jgi:hypothetical protein
MLLIVQADNEYSLFNDQFSCAFDEGYRGNFTIINKRTMTLLLRKGSRVSGSSSQTQPNYNTLSCAGHETDITQTLLNGHYLMVIVDQLSGFPRVNVI